MNIMTSKQHCGAYRPIATLHQLNSSLYYVISRLDYCNDILISLSGPAVDPQLILACDTHITDLMS